jgi:hypothetical protein
MAAITPDNIFQDILGSLRLIVARFSAGTADDDDTWDSGINSFVTCVAQDTDDPTTQGSVGVAVEFSAGVFTFHPAEDNKSFDLLIYVRS